MGEDKLKERVQDFVNRRDANRQSLLEEVVIKIDTKLWILYAGRHSDQQRINFEMWLCAQFEYDRYTVRNIFDQDEDLKLLMDCIDTIHGNMAGRAQAAAMVNARLRAAGKIRQFGINGMFSDVIGI